MEGRHRRYCNIVHAQDISFFLPSCGSSSGEGELSAERTNAHRRDCSNDTDIVHVRSEGGDSEGCGGGGQLEALACLHHCHVDDVTDDDSILQVCSRRTPGDGG